MSTKKIITTFVIVILAAAIITAGVIFLPQMFNSPGDTNTPGVSGTQTPGNTSDAAEGDFEYYNDAALGGVVITKYIGKSNTAKVPETIGGKTVVKVEDSTFQDCSSLVNITTLYFGGTFAYDVTVRTCIQKRLSKVAK